MQHQEIDLTEYMDVIQDLVGRAISTVILSKIVKDGKVKDDKISKDMLHHQIELELASRWQKAAAKRAKEVRLSRVYGRVESYLKSYPVSDSIFFDSCEEQELAEKLLQERGYKTSHVSDEGMDGVKYWPADEEEPFEGI